LRRCFGAATAAALLLREIADTEAGAASPAPERLVVLKAEKILDIDNGKVLDRPGQPVDIGTGANPRVLTDPAELSIETDHQRPPVSPLGCRPSRSLVPPTRLPSTVG